MGILRKIVDGDLPADVLVDVVDGAVDDGVAVYGRIQRGDALGEVGQHPVDDEIDLVDRRAGFDLLDGDVRKLEGDLGAQPARDRSPHGQRDGDDARILCLTYGSGCDLSNAPDGNTVENFFKCLFVSHADAVKHLLLKFKRGVPQDFAIFKLFVVMEHLSERFLDEFVGPFRLCKGEFAMGDKRTVDGELQIHQKLDAVVEMIDGRIE